MPLLAALCLLAAVSWSSLTLLGIYHLAWSGPFRDIWEFIGDIQQQLQGNWSFAYLIDAYGGAHRIFLPKLVFWADYRFFAGSNFLTISLSLLCQLISLWLYITVWRQSALASWQRCLLIAAMIAALFHAGQLFNFLYAMDVQWFMANTLALAAMICALRAQTIAQLWLAFMFAIGASLCNFTGLMAVLLVCICGFFFFRKHKAKLAEFLFAAAIGAYLMWYVQTGKSSENFILASLLNSADLKEFVIRALLTLYQLIPFTLKMLSNPLSREWPVTGITIAALSIVFLLQQTWRLRHSRSQASQLAVLGCWYILLGCAFTALGRILYPNTATAERYLTLTLPYTVLIISLLWLALEDRKQQLAALLSVPLLAFFYSSTSLASLEFMTQTSQQQQLAQAAARSNVLALDYTRGSLSFPMAQNGHNAVADFNDWLREQKLGFYSQPPQITHADSWPDKVTQQLPQCNGQINTQRRVGEKQWRIEGQLLHPTQHIQQLIFGDQQYVIGFAHNIQPANAWLPWQQADNRQWFFAGFVNELDIAAAQLPSTNYQVLGINRRGDIICQAQLAVANNH